MSKKKTVVVGQVCWLTGGYDYNLSGRLVKVVAIRDKRLCRGIEVVLLNIREDDLLDFKNGGRIGVSSPIWLFTSPEEYLPFCEGTPDSISQPKPTRHTKCGKCESKVTKNMKFCGECGVAISSRL